jgi:hypothetical protein
VAGREVGQAARGVAKTDLFLYAQRTAQAVLPLMQMLLQQPKRNRSRRIEHASETWEVLL